MNKKILAIVLLFISIILLDICGVSNIVNAAEINSASLYSVGECGDLLTYKGVTVKVTYVKYSNGNLSYPAYCLNKNLPGITSENIYSVDVQNAITDVGLWKVIVNGYPYKTIEELGCMSEQEAFTATKQAVYCQIHENQVSDYGAIGEAGQRTLNALKLILTNAQNSDESKISSNIEIVRKSDDWKVDKIDSNYVSKVYSINSNANFKTYNIILSDGIEGIKITDINNQEKIEFNSDEMFKVLIPISNMKKDGIFKLKVNAMLETKPVLYGKSQDQNYQDYALTAETYESSNGEIKEEYKENITTLIVIKKDKDTEEKLSGVEFELLDDEKNVIHNNLITDENGEIKISGLKPGKYFIKETNAKDGYIINDDYIEIDIEYNSVFTLTVDNKKEDEKTKIVKQENEKISTKKLPVTGM